TAILRHRQHPRTPTSLADPPLKEKAIKPQNFSWKGSKLLKMNLFVTLHGKLVTFHAEKKGTLGHHQQQTKNKTFEQNCPITDGPTILLSSCCESRRESRDSNPQQTQQNTFNPQAVK
ncbi:unnamed protein product, partial [Nesidiocoris tenuis]